MLIITLAGASVGCEDIAHEFDSHRSGGMAALLLTIATFINAVFCISVGALVDRLGPRLVGLLEHRTG